MNTLKVICLTFLFFLSCYSYCQKSEDLKFRHISLEEGLSNGLVKCVIQDSKGYIWIGTDDGLNRFNGHDFTIYRHDPTRPESIVGNSINHLLEDSKGRLWIATEGGLDRYDPDWDRFIHFKSNENANIQTLCEDHLGVLWVGTTDGLATLSEATGELQYHNVVINNPALPKSFSDPYFSITEILEVDENKMVIGTWNGLLIFDRSTQKFDWLKKVENDKNSLPDNQITSMVFDRTKRLWIGTNGGGIAAFDLSDYSFDPFPLEDPKVPSVFADKHNHLWVGTEQSGLLKIALDSIDDQDYQYGHYEDRELKGSLSYRTVTSIYQDREDNMWIGTYGAGINFVSAYAGFFQSIQRIPLLTNTLTHKKVWGLCEDNQGNLWIGTDGGGLNHYNIKTKVFTYYDHIPSDKNSISDNAILSGAKDIDGTLWFGTYAGGLNHFDPQKNRFKRYRHHPDDSSSLGSNDVREIFPDSRGNLWLGTNQGGLNLFNRATGDFKRYTTANSEISSNDIRSIYEDRKGRLWIGTYQEGFNQFYEGKFTNFKISGLENTSLNCNTVFSICEDQAGNVWLGTYGGGLVRFSPDNGQFKIYSEKQGLSNNIIHAIVPDSSGNFWITTNNGISKFNLAEARFENFDTKDGLPSNVFNDGSWLKGSDGTIYFGSLNGLVYFNPSLQNENFLNPPALVLEKLRIFNEEVRPTGKKHAILDKEIGETDRISLNYKQSVFTIDYAALSFASPDKVQYAYKLEGIENDWNYVGSQTSATYTTLPSGDYVFSVIASYDGIHWTSTPKNLGVAILPAPWKTWWAYTCYALVIAAVLYTSRRYKLNKVALKNRLEIEKLERKKISEIYGLKMKFFTNVSHEFRTPLTLVISPLQEMIRSRSLKPSIRKRLIYIYNHAHRLLNLVNQLMEFRKAETGHLQLRVSENNIVDFAYDVYESFSEVAKIKKIDFTFETHEESVLVWFDQNHFEIILYNLISNAFKYTPERGKIKLSVRKAEDKSLQSGIPTTRFCEIRVRDNGKGISPEHVNSIFDRYYQVIESETIDIMGTGIGLALVKDLVNLHHGSISVSSQKGIFTEIVLRFPLGRSHFSDRQLDFTSENNTRSISYNPFSELEPESSRQDPCENNARPKLLVVEDNPEIRAYIKAIFQEEYCVREAENGQAGLEKAGEEIPDIIISDIMMPVLNGIEFCTLLKKGSETAHIPVVLLTARGDDQHKIEGISIGADAYLTKPFNAELLKAKVQGLRQSRAKLKEYYSRNITLQPGNVDITAEDEVFLQSAMGVVEDNLSNEAFGVKELMDALCMSQPTLYRKIKVLTGESPSEFIRSIRLKTAAQLFRQGQSSVAQVSYDVGFNSVRYFRSCFKNQFGKTPSEYLKEQKLTA